MPLCQLCSAAESRYKCPTCLIPYCSLACYKPHKTAHEEAPPAPTEPPTSTTISATTTTSITAPAVPPTTTEPTSTSTSTAPTATYESSIPPLSTAPDSSTSFYAPLLTHPTLLPHLLRNPTLHSLLYQIYLSTLEPPPPIQTNPTSTPTNPYKITKHHKKQPIWTPAVGISRGVKRLSKIREKGLREGGEGGALEEFIGGMLGVCVGDGGNVSRGQGGLDLV